MAFDNKDKVPNKYLVLDDTGLPTGADGSLLIYNTTTGIWEATLLPFDVRNPSHALLVDRDANDQHPMSAITGLLDALNNKADNIHIHAISDVTDLQNQLDALNNKKLGDLSDVILTNLSNLEVITWNPTADGGNGAWINMNASILAGTGDNLGNHTATQNLSMSNFNIKNVAPSVDGTDAINQNELFAQRIEGHSNVNITNVQDLNILSYDDASHKWINVDISSIINGDNLGDHNATQILNMNGYEIKGVGSPQALDSAVPLNLLNSSIQNLQLGDLSDVTYSGLDDRYVILYSSTTHKWETVPAEDAGDNLGNHTATNNLNMADNKIIHLSDAVAADEGVNKGQLDNQKISEHGDTQISNIQNGDTIIYDTNLSAWINDELIEINSDEPTENVRLSKLWMLDNVTPNLTHDEGALAICVSLDPGYGLNHTWRSITGQHYISRLDEQFGYAHSTNVVQAIDTNNPITHYDYGNATNSRITSTGSYFQNKAFIIGGEVPPYNLVSKSALSLIESFPIRQSSGNINVVGNLAEIRAAHCTTQYNNKCYSFGGVSAGNYRSSAEYFDMSLSPNVTSNMISAILPSGGQMFDSSYLGAGIGYYSPYNNSGTSGTLIDKFNMNIDVFNSLTSRSIIGYGQTYLKDQNNNKIYIISQSDQAYTIFDISTETDNAAGSCPATIGPHGISGLNFGIYSNVGSPSGATYMNYSTLTFNIAPYQISLASTNRRGQTAINASGV